MPIADLRFLGSVSACSGTKWKPLDAKVLVPFRNKWDWGRAG